MTHTASHISSLISIPLFVVVCDLQKFRDLDGRLGKVSKFVSKNCKTFEIWMWAGGGGGGGS